MEKNNIKAILKIKRTKEKKTQEYVLYSKYIFIIITQITGNQKVPDSSIHEHLKLLYNQQAATLVHLYTVWKVKN